MFRFKINFDELNIWKMVEKGNTLFYLLPKNFQPKDSGDIQFVGMLIKINNIPAKVEDPLLWEEAYNSFGYRKLDAFRIQELFYMIPDKILEKAKQLNQ